MDVIKIILLEALTDYNIPINSIIGIKCNTKDIVNIYNFSNYLMNCDITGEVINIPNTPICYIIGPRILYDTHFKYTYNDKYIFCNYSYTEDKSVILSGLLEFHKYVMGIDIILDSYKYTIKTRLDSINKEDIIPTSKPFINTMYNIIDCIVNKLPYVINMKHDGIACWIYVSDSIPMTLINQKKKRTGLNYNIKGILNSKKTSKEYLFFCEYVALSDTYFLIDIASDEKSYYNRFLSVCDIYKYENLNIVNNIKLTINNITVPNKPINDYLGYSLNPGMDGVILYLPNNPMKLKLMERSTVDIEFNKHLYNNTNNGWKTNIPQLKQIEQPKDEDIVLIDDCKIYEVSILESRIIKERTDRISPNPDELIKKIMQNMLRDKKYNNIYVWKGECVHYYLMVNRMHKRYLYIEHVPKEANLIDMGSGYAAEKDTWVDSKYKVIAVESNSERVKILKRNVENNKNVIVYETDMKDIFSHLSNLTYKYRYVTMMRSITNNDETYIRDVIKGCNKHNIYKIVILTVLPEYVKDGVYKCYCGGKLHCSFSMHTTASTINFSYEYEGRKEVYQDFKYDKKFWNSVAEDNNYSIEFEDQSKITNVFCANTVNSAISRTDIGIILTKKSHLL